MINKQEMINKQKLLEEINLLTITVGGKEIFPKEAKKTVLKIIEEQPIVELEKQKNIKSY